MASLPNFDKFKIQGTSFIDGFKNAIDKRDWKWLIPYCLGWLVIVILFYWGVRAAYYAAYPQSDNIAPTTTESSIHIPIRLRYEKRAEQRDSEKGLYKTTFGLYVTTPPYWRPKDPENFDGNYQIKRHIGIDAECSELEKRGTTWTSGGSYSSTTQEYEIACETYTPILDNGILFSVRED